MNKSARKKYESPQLRSVTAIESGSAICCKATPGACSNSTKGGLGKGQRTKDSS